MLAPKRCAGIEDPHPLVNGDHCYLGLTLLIIAMLAFPEAGEPEIKPRRSLLLILTSPLLKPPYFARDSWEGGAVPWLCRAVSLPFDINLHLALAAVLLMSPILMKAHQR